MLLIPINDSEWPELLTLEQVGEILQIKSIPRIKYILEINGIKPLVLTRQTWRIRKRDLMMFITGDGSEPKDNNAQTGTD